MPIKKKSIRSLRRYARLLPSSLDVVVGVIDPSTASLQRIGFSAALADGETVLPAVAGPRSEHNAEGSFIKHRDRPMEEASRMTEWTWTECHGKDRFERTEFREVPYMRYPRTFMPPPSIELTLATDASGRRVVRSPLIAGWKDHEDAVLHASNLFLELFGECTFFGGGMNSVISAPVRRLNWKILPPGERPFPQLKALLQGALSMVKEGNSAYAEHRLETVNRYKPDFAAVGAGGFTGYVILGFRSRNLYILESILYGNATYVLGEDWEALARMTKAEILSASLHRHRFVHHRGWNGDIARLLGQGGDAPLLNNAR